MENLAKPKLKTKWSDSPLFWQSKYEFVAPYGMDEAIRRINALGRKYRKENQEFWRFFFPLDNFAVDSQEDNGGVFNFKISGSQSRVALKAHLLGNLLYENDQQTRVKIWTGFTMASTVSFIALFPMMCAMVFITTRASNSFEIVVALGISFGLFSFISLIDIFSGYSLKADLYDDLREVLSLARTPRPQTLPP